MGFHRLAIMDRSMAGDQPFIVKDSRRTIYCICNGEIYNFHELCHVWKLDNVLTSNADTEIIPHLYLRLGFEIMVSQLRGEFAIVLVDIDHEMGTSVVHVARDRFGVRPLFYGYDDRGFAICSEMKGLLDVVDVNSIKQFPCGNVATCNVINSIFDCTFQQYYERKYPIVVHNGDFVNYLSQTKLAIRNCFTAAVESMLEADRPLGALLSGGLDSSLVVAVASRFLKQHGCQRLRTFSIGLPGSTDEKYARRVAEHCDTVHTHIELTNEDFLGAVKDVVWITETFDITTIRATVGQYLIARWISQNTNIKVLLIGDGSDELTAGYKYFHKAPSARKLHRENERLLQEINFFDVLRADRGIAHCGLEARVPFLDYHFVDLYMSVDPQLRTPVGGVEKWLLRHSFNGYLPEEVLYRSKEAFSDGVSSETKSWFQIIQEKVNASISDAEFLECQQQFRDHLPPPSKEAAYYRLMFTELFHGCKGQVVPHFWLPKWCGDITEPSARVLDVYDT